MPSPAELRIWDATDGRQPPQPLLARTGGPDDGSLHCFVVDDDLGVRQTIARIVRRAGDQVHEFESAAELARGIRDIRPDIIFLDIGLCGSDAVEAVQLLRDEHYRGILQIVSGRDPDLLRSVQRVSTRYGLEGLPPIKKPFRQREIHGALDLARSMRARARPASPPASPDQPPTSLPADILDMALQRGWIESRYQPKVDLRSGKLIGAESLLRVHHPELGLLAPGGVLANASPAAVDRLVEHTIVAAMRHWATFKQVGLNLRLAVNVPLSSLVRLPVGDLVRETRPRDEDWPGLLIEVLETEAIEDVGLLDAVTTQLKIYQAELSIDDFGCGFSSLSRLRDLSFAEIKLDRSFVHGCNFDAGKQAICQTASDLARRFGASFVAEGISDPADLHCLMRLGCGIGQGFLFAEALSVPALVERHAEGRDWIAPDAHASREPAAAVDPFTTAAAEGLTRRERDILGCVLRGLSSKEIGRELGVSYRTVEVHRARAMAKLGARNTAELLGLLLG